jgi:[ribosomal protein S18]-alanine N-acetyltransferase
VTLRLPGRHPAAPPDPGSVFDLSIVEMRRRHVREVVAIEQQIFPRPWSSALYLSELTMPQHRIYLVALANDAVVGYAGAMLVVGEAHVTTIGVAPEFQRRHIGTRLMLELTTAARARESASMTLEVRWSNHGAQEMYQRFGFVPAGVRKNYYAEVGEDALVMWAYDIDTEQYGSRLAAIRAGLEAPTGGPTSAPTDGPGARPEVGESEQGERG